MAQIVSENYADEVEEMDSRIQLFLKTMNRLFAITVFLVLVGCSFSKKQTLAFYSEAEEQAPYHAIIVPGVPFDGNNWSATMKSRVLWSYYLYKNGLTKNVIYSGGAVYTKYYEAKIMAEYGKALGIPAEHIFLDTLAEHSAENVYYSYLVAKKNAFTKVAFATDPFQAKQLKGMITKLELPIDFLPIVTDSIDVENHPDPTINPANAVKENFNSITERESFFTRFKGTMGRQIMFYEEDLPNEKTVKKFRKRGQLIEK